MQRELARLALEEAAAAADKRARAAALMAEVADANADQIEGKRQQAEREREEEARIADYIRQRDAREQVGRRGGRANGAQRPGPAAAARPSRHLSSSPPPPRARKPTPALPQTDARPTPRLAPGGGG